MSDCVIGQGCSDRSGHALKRHRVQPAQTSVLLGVLFAWLGLGASACAQSAQPVQQLDLNRYVGAWYEVAHLPDKREKHCVSDAIALFTVSEKKGHFDIVTSCRVADGTESVQNASGKLADKSSDGKTKVYYLYPFSEKDWVLAVGADYSWVLVGTPNHKNLFILSRNEKLDPAVLSDLRARASAEGYDAAKLIEVKQDPLSKH